MIVCDQNKLSSSYNVSTLGYDGYDFWRQNKSWAHRNQINRPKTWKIRKITCVFPSVLVEK